MYQKLMLDPKTLTMKHAKVLKEKYSSRNSLLGVKKEIITRSRTLPVMEVKVHPL